MVSRDGLGTPSFNAQRVEVKRGWFLPPWIWYVFPMVCPSDQPKEAPGVFFSLAKEVVKGCPCAPEMIWLLVWTPGGWIWFENWCCAISPDTVFLGVGTKEHMFYPDCLSPLLAWTIRPAPWDHILGCKSQSFPLWIRMLKYLVSSYLPSVLLISGLWEMIIM